MALFRIRFFIKQIRLNHQVLDRLKELNMHPIVQAFAGFVPDGVKDCIPVSNCGTLSGRLQQGI